MTRLLRSWLPLLCAATVLAQAPAPPVPGGQPGAPRAPQPPPSNLKVLPKDMSRADVVKIMRGYEGDLGVECEFCHAQSPATKRMDFASDANPMKDTARYMMTMMDEINNKSLAHVTNLKDADKIGCGTCHRGMAVPVAFVPKPQPPRPPAAPATAPIMK
jgi:hypothetical protein